MFQHDVHPGTIGQLVTVQDGVEIYEGDILVDRFTDEDNQPIHGYFPILWDCKQLGWAIDCGFKKDDTNLIELTEFFTGDLEVSGNIFDNHEMIEI